MYRVFSLAGSYTWTAPSNVSRARVRVVGAGGGCVGGIIGDGFACGGSPFGNAIGIYEAPGTGLDVCGGMSSNPINAVIRFPFDGFTGCGSDSTVSAGPGGGGYGHHGNKAGGGGGGLSGTGYNTYAGIGGGVGGGYDTASNYDHAGDGRVGIGGKGGSR